MKRRTTSADVSNVGFDEPAASLPVPGLVGIGLRAEPGESIAELDGRVGVFVVDVVAAAAARVAAGGTAGRSTVAAGASSCRADEVTVGGGDCCDSGVFFVGRVTGGRVAGAGATAGAAAAGTVGGAFSARGQAHTQVSQRAVSRRERIKEGACREMERVPETVSVWRMTHLLEAAARRQAAR